MPRRRGRGEPRWRQASPSTCIETSTRPWTATTRVARAYLPNPEHAEVYGQRFEMYAELVDAMAPFWRRLNAAPDGPGA